jgi:hypothetical protein
MVTLSKEGENFIREHYDLGPERIALDELLRLRQIVKVLCASLRSNPTTYDLEMLYHLECKGVDTGLTST